MRLRWLKIPLFAACLAPLATLAWRGWHGDLTANPVEYITRATGEWTLRFLVFTLAVTPLRRALGRPELIRVRRMLGLFAFFYGVLHLTTWLWLDRFFDLREMAEDLTKRRFIVAGMTAFALMVPLAATSTAAAIRRLGGARWRRLHRLVYASALAGVVHYYWLVKSDVREPLVYGAIVGLLLCWRLLSWLAARDGGRVTVAGAGSPDKGSGIRSKGCGATGEDVML